MRSFIALSLAVTATLAEDIPAEAAAPVVETQAAPAASPVHVARAPFYGNRAYGNRAPFVGAYGNLGARVAAPYYAARAGTPYYAAAPAISAYNPYALRAAQATAPVVAAPAPVQDFDHSTDYANWRLAYLTSKAEEADALSFSPMLSPNWNHRGGAPFDQGQAGILYDQYKLEAAKGKMFAAEYALNQAAELGAPVSELQELKKLYDYEKLNQMNLLLSVTNPVITYQLARQDYEWDATAAEQALRDATTPQEKRKAQLDMQEAQIDLMDAMSPVVGGGLSYPGKLSTMVRFMGDSESAKGRQMSFDEAAAEYERSPTPVNMYELQIAELKLEKAEASYMNSLAGFVSPLAALLNGNYQSSLKYKKEQVEAKIAGLEEKLAAATYTARHGRAPFGRTSNKASSMKTQRAFFNLLSSGRD